METDNYKGPYSMVNLMTTEKDFIKYAQSINKALNGTEMAVKPKHLRSTIIGTFREQGAQTFWSVALRLPYLDDRIVAWKLCYVVHKVLREGHPLCLVHSQRHKKELDEMGQLWRHLRGTYSQTIRIYCNLLITKIDFHNKNPRFPGNLIVTDEELESIVSDDINNYFQLSVEMFDYLDRIIELQAAIFGPINVTQFKAEALSGGDQCLLAPIILCLQDASKLYDYCVKIMFKLHASLPSDVIAGHRERFLKVFSELKVFYSKTNSISYLRELITVPPLPKDPPDFFTASDFYTYITQEVTLSEEKDETAPASKKIVSFASKAENISSNERDESHGYNEKFPDPPEATLIDISEDGFQSNPFKSHQSVSDNWEFSPSAPIYESVGFKTEKVDEENLINENEKWRKEFDSTVQDNERQILSLQGKISALETALAMKEKELSDERQRREILENSSIPSDLSHQYGMPGEELHKVKDLYAKLRKDYVNLLMKNGELQKQVRSLEIKLAELENESPI